MTLEEIMDKLNTEYPNEATALFGLSDSQAKEYLAKIELIEYIKLLKDK